MDIEVNTLRITVTLISLALFVALMVYSWSRRRAPEYAAAAMLPFLGEMGEMGEMGKMGEDTTGEQK